MRNVLDALPEEQQRDPAAVELRVAQAIAETFNGNGTALDAEIAFVAIMQYTRYLDTTLPGTPMETQKQIEGRREVGQFILDACALAGREPVGLITAVRRAPPIEENT